ncbi:hypothetical protein V6N13_032052 [Hibiscus sabdariffa]
MASLSLLQCFLIPNCKEGSSKKYNTWLLCVRILEYMIFQPSAKPLSGWLLLKIFPMSLSSSSLSAVMIWYLRLRLAGRCSASSSSGLDGLPWSKLCLAVALPRFLVGESGVGLAITAAVVGVGAAERIGAAGAGVDVDGPSANRWSLGDCQSNTSFSSSDEK